MVAVALALISAIRSPEAPPPQRIVIGGEAKAGAIIVVTATPRPESAAPVIVEQAPKPTTVVEKVENEEPQQVTSGFPETPEQAAALFGGDPSWWNRTGSNGWLLTADRPANIDIPSGWRADYEGHSCANGGQTGVYGDQTVRLQWATLWYVADEQNCGRN